MRQFRVGVPVSARNAPEAAATIIETLGADENSINDIGGVTVEEIPARKPYLVCRGCGEAFDSLLFARDHGVFIPGLNPAWCGEAGFDIVPEEEAL